MDRGFRFTLEQASAAAPEVDAHYYFIWAVTAFFTLLIFCLIVYLSLRYRRRSEDERPRPTVESLRLELTYTFIPLIIVMVIFFWGVRTYFYVYGEPKDPLDVYVTGKQWMWKIQHPDGKRELNELHLPLGREVQLTMGSQDVLHSFFIPAFRAKMDVVPGRYTKMAFTPTVAGEYPLFCTEYCGAQHSDMIGRVFVMEPEKYQAWLRGTPADEPLATAGEKLFNNLGCLVCHGAHAPSMAGLFGSERAVRTPEGQKRTVKVDEAYLRRAIHFSTEEIVEGYEPIMPSFRGQITEEQLTALIAYIKSVRDRTEVKAGEVPAATEQRGLER